MTRFERTANESDLDSAIAAGQEAAASASASYEGYKSDLGNMLLARYRLRGDLDDLENAIDQYRLALAATTADRPDYAAFLSNLGNALELLYERTGDPGDLDVAIDQGQRALSKLPPDHPNRGVYLSNVGKAFRARYDKTGERADLNAAEGYYQEAAMAESAPAAVRLVAARWWGFLAAMRSPSEGLAGYTLAVNDLLALTAWHGLDHDTRRYHLTRFSGLAIEAADVAISAGAPDRAVELLENGRSVLWRQALNLRSDLTDLAEQAPDLAQALNEARTVLDKQGPTVLAETPQADTAASVEERATLVQARKLAGRAWDTMLEHVRQHVDGFEDFLRPAPFRELATAAIEGPVVILIAGRHRPAQRLSLLRIVPSSRCCPARSNARSSCGTSECTAHHASTSLGRRHPLGGKR